MQPQSFVSNKIRKKAYSNTYVNCRKGTINVIQDMLNGYEAYHAKERWKLSTSQIPDEDWFKMFISFEYMKKVINELKILAPMMDSFTTNKVKQVKVLKKMLKTVQWNQLLYEIYETLETKGDFFAYWNEGDDNKVNGIPNLVVLDSENMEDIELDPYTKQPIKYIYKDWVEEKVIDEKTGTVSYINGRDRTIIFAKGYIRINDTFKFEKGYEIFYNKNEYSDMIRLIHIPSFKKKNEIFSEIPAQQYIDPCLLLDKIDTNRHTINDHLGFPFPFIVGGYVNADKSFLVPGGQAVVEPEDWLKNASTPIKPDIVKMEINNDLKSIVDEKLDAVSDLYKKACLIREALEEKLSSSDSSRNISQMRLGIEQKNKKYYTNIAESQGMRDYIKVVLMENGVWNKTDEDNITFEVPTILINNSVFDELLMKAQLRALGESTLEDELIAKGKNESEIKAHKDKVNEELYGKNNDMSFQKSNNVVANEITDRVSNGSNVQGLDNNFKG